MKLIFGAIYDITLFRGKQTLKIFKRGKKSEDDIIYVIRKKVNNIKVYDKVILIIFGYKYCWVLKNRLGVFTCLFIPFHILLTLFGYNGFASMLIMLNLFYLIEYHESYSDLDSIITKLTIWISYTIIILYLVLMNITYVLKM